MGTGLRDCFFRLAKRYFTFDPQPCGERNDNSGIHKVEDETETCLNETCQTCHLIIYFVFPKLQAKTLFLWTVDGGAMPDPDTSFRS